MIDFKSKLGSKSIQKKLNPIEIYEELDRKSETGPLRPLQKEILTEWYSFKKNENSLILKLHTGQGKTLIGLLILQSKLNENKDPCLYVCPNKYLVEQTCIEAEKFGIGYVTLEKDNSLPDKFLNGEKILITHVQKLFNGKSIFGIEGKSTQVNSIILDDSHACIDAINKSFKIVVTSQHELYKQLFRMFQEDLREQGEGSFLEIQDGDYNTLLPVPYWSWFDKRTEVIKAISKYRDTQEVMFVRELIKNDIESYQCFFSGKKLEISLISSPIEKFGTFHKAKHRILMSATTQNDSFFIKGLWLNSEIIRNPLTPKQEKWSGEKMILIPSLIHEELDRNVIINEIAKEISQAKTGRVAITSSYRNARLYENIGSEITNTTNILDKVTQLKNGNYHRTVVIVNRYDGIDLPDNVCRILIVDSMPYSSSLTESYEEECRENSEIVSIRNSQKIEQGLGRSVRGERDYSVILIIGNDLVKFLKSKKYNRLFSKQTQKQIELGIEISYFSKEELKINESPITTIFKLIEQCLNRDEGWKEFYKERMDNNQYNNKIDDDSHLLEVLELEQKAEIAFRKNELDKAINCINLIINNYCQNNDREKGWYLQILARYEYKQSKTNSNATQKSANKINSLLLKPREGINYKKLSYINSNRIEKIKKYVSSHETYEELMITINEITEALSFGRDAEKFEKALQELGSAIGFLSQRPDREIKKGPDNLWCVSNDFYFIFECKSEVKDSRQEISKTETGQMNNHCGWFDQQYNTKNVKRILVIPTKNVSEQGNFTHDVEIMRKGKLKSLKENFKSFFKEFKDYMLCEVSDDRIQNWIATHHLDIKSLKTMYSERYYQKR